MDIADVFHTLIACHIVTGAIGLLAFWVPVGGRKGGRAHRSGGRVFIHSMLITGSLAVGISACTLLAPIETHPHLLHHELFGDAASIRAIFGWMMLYLAILTVTLAWHGRLCIIHKRDKAAVGAWHNLALHMLLLATAANCAVQGALAGQGLMIGISLVGFATVATNLWYIYAAPSHPTDWLVEHVKALIGAGISVYTAFFAFGAVRLLPEAALTPALWSAPLTIGLALIIYHRRALVSRSVGRAPVQRT